MKLRINGNSIRLRLTKNEVEDLVKNGSTTSSCHIGTEALVYSLVHGNQDSISAELKPGKVIVTLPTSLVKNWDIDERVGFDYKTDDGLYVLVEKDFTCLTPRDHEDESNLYPNPLA